MYSAIIHQSTNHELVINHSLAFWSFFLLDSQIRVWLRIKLLYCKDHRFRVGRYKPSNMCCCTRKSLSGLCSILCFSISPVWKKKMNIRWDTQRLLAVSKTFNIFSVHQEPFLGNFSRTWKFLPLIFSAVLCVCWLCTSACQWHYETGKWTGYVQGRDSYHVNGTDCLWEWHTPSIECFL